MNPIKAEIPARYIAALYPFIPKSDVRFYLCGVRVEPAPEGGINMVATDGHRILVINAPEGFCSRAFIMQVPPEIYRLCKARTPRIQRLAKQHLSRLVVRSGLIHAVIGTYLDRGVSAAQRVNRKVDPKDLVCAWTFGEIDGRYPNWIRPFGSGFQRGNGNGYPCVNPKYLADFDAAASILSGDEAVKSMRIQAKDDESPLIISLPKNNDGASGIGCVMPMTRTGIPYFDDVPNFMKPPQEQEAA